MIHIYTGNGKGKTTAAFGLAMRASGQGLKVAIFQFLKPKRLLCGERISTKRLRAVKLVCFEELHPIFTSDISLSELKRNIRNDFDRVKKTIFSNRYDVVILDEIINAVDQNFISKDALSRLLKKVPEKIELILTGRGDISSIEKYADYVTVMIEKKHPFRNKIGARKGIEY